ncbi:hypothetical protein [Streptomyces sp. NPDC008240]|uniref:hypothetical protein n=1 Tax=Streptomyces sp. NPDC008240 TaxID=3364822 RepID=UPI0036E3A5C0
MPRCAWILIGSLFLILNQTIGTAATLAIPFQILAWTVHTPAALVMIASLAGWHLLNYHAPRRRRTAPAHP